jgi:hypothetical protein
MTLRYWFGQDDANRAIAGFVSAMVPHVRARGFGPCQAIGVVNADNELIAGFVYHHLSPEAGVMEISAAALPGQRWLTRTTLHVIYHYPFVTCGCQTVIHTVRASHRHLLRPLAVLGCKMATIERLFGRDEDGIVATLTDDRWAANKFSARKVARQQREAA